MTNNKINFYVVALHNNMYNTPFISVGASNEEREQAKKESTNEKIRCYMRKYKWEGGFEAEFVPVLAVESPNKTCLLEYFTHKPIYEKTEPAMNGLSYTSKREATAEELILISKYSKMLKECPDTIDHYVHNLSEIEQRCINEYAEYIKALEELENIYNSSDLQRR